MMLDSMTWDLVPTPQGFINLVKRYFNFGSTVPKSPITLTEGMLFNIGQRAYIKF